jgi:putative ABC transport system permease protein
MVVVVNETLARQFFPGEDPVGHRITYGRRGAQTNWRTIIGVVGDEKQDGLAAQVWPEVFDAALQDPDDRMTLVVRVARDPASLAPDVRAMVRAIDPNVAVYDLEPMTTVMAAALGRDRFLTYLLVAFAVLALVLATVGLYGVLACAVSQRTQEIGVRIALGAKRRDVLSLIVKSGVGLVAAGLVLGLVVAVWTSRLMAGLLFGVTPVDSLTFLAVSALFVLVAVAAIATPARRAARVDPVVSLRCG